MGIFASRSTKVVEVPFDKPNTITVRQLVGRQLGKAQQAFWAVLSEQSRGQVALQKDLAELRAVISGDDGPKSDEDKAAEAKAKREAVSKAAADPLNGFDPATLILLGVTEWTYPEAITAEVIDDLSDEAMTFFASEVLRHTKPALFKSEDERKADQKND